MMILMKGASILSLFCFLFFHKVRAAELDIISDSKFLTDGDTLVSETGIFELGFFQPGSSENRYLGIWFKKISVRTVVWVANRETPLPGVSPLLLKVVDAGNLVLFNNMSTIWSSNTTMTSQNATARLQDTGNLVLTDQQERIIWQSFDYPTDTLLYGMKIGKDYLRGIEWYLSSWKNNQDPAQGEFSWSADTHGYPDTDHAWFNMSITMEECKAKCLNNCSCMAYANPEMGFQAKACLLWFDDLIDTRLSPQSSGGQDLFIRMASFVIFPGVLLISIISTWLWYARIKTNNARLTEEVGSLHVSKNKEEDIQLPLFSFSTIATATASFSTDNIVGEGGFGPVYKGVLEGLLIAVKRLSRTSDQGDDEFKNEVICISRLQHRNLVKLLGFAALSASAYVAVTISPEVAKLRRACRIIVFLF